MRTSLRSQLRGGLQELTEFNEPSTAKKKRTPKSAKLTNIHVLSETAFATPFICSTFSGMLILS